MTFDIARTPTLEAVVTADEQALAEDLKKRVAEALSDAEKQPEVAAAVASQKIAGERVEKLRAAQRILNQYAKDARERLAKASEATVDMLVDSAAEQGKPEFGKLSELVGIEIKNRYASRALEQIAEHRIPLAQIVGLRGESHALLARARAVERIAQGRAERVLTQMREAITEEMVLPVDLSKGVAGALLAHAAGLKRRAVQLSESADDFERSYTDRRRGKEGRA
jgi:hypothetical protein